MRVGTPATPVLTQKGSLSHPTALNTLPVLLTMASQDLTHWLVGDSFLISANSTCLGSLLKHFKTSATAPLIGLLCTDASPSFSDIHTVSSCTYVPLMPPRFASLDQLEITSNN